VSWARLLTAFVDRLSGSPFSSNAVRVGDVSGEEFVLMELLGNLFLVEVRVLVRKGGSVREDGLI
jgi:hypothetical protein